MMHRYQRLALGLVVLGMVVGLLVLGFRDAMARKLEDWTGETNFRQQLESLVLYLRQRPIETADLVPVAYAGVNPYGANTFFEQEVEEWKLRRSMEMLRDAGVRWVRQEMPWDRIEVPAKGQYLGSQGSSWASYDRFIDLASEYGLNIVARLDLPPPWAKKDNSVPRSPPDNFADYGDFVYTFVNRYQGKIKYYQIWNEPNLYGEWGKTPSAREYVELLKVGYTRAKEADPNVVILSAPLSQTLGTPDGLNQSDLTFLQDMYDVGAKDYFDILSAQGHGLWTGPGDRRVESNQTNFSRLRLIREIMVRNGDANKSVWVSEMGWDAVPSDFPSPASYGRVSEERQARYTMDAYRRAQDEWPWLGVIFYWYFRKVSDESRREVDFYYRMVDPDFTPHPVYYAYQKLATSPLLVNYGYHQENHWALNYEGPWPTVASKEASMGAYAVSTSPGAKLSLRFRGTELDLVTSLGPQGGKLYVELDGAPYKVNRLPLDEAGRAYLDLHSCQPQGQVRLPIARGLTNGEHSVTMEVGEGGGEVIIDGLIVQRESTTLTRRFWGALLLAGLGLTLVLLLAQRRNHDGVP